MLMQMFLNQFEMNLHAFKIIYSEIRINSGKHLVTICRGTDIADKKILTSKTKKKRI